MIGEYLLYICCPRCKSDLFFKNSSLICHSCKRKYQIIDEIPILVDLYSIPDHLKKQIQYFENNPEYNLHYKLAEWQASYLDRFKKNVETINKTLILDNGAGSGYMTIELAKLGARVIACDLTLKSQIHLKKVASILNLLDRIVLLCCSSQELPIKSEVIDSFISNAILEHLPEEKKAINEINRVCKQSSSLMVAVPLNYRFINPILLPVNIIHDWKIGHLRRYCKESIQNKLIGWSLINCYYTGHFLKVILVLINSIFHIFNEKRIELLDKKSENKKCGASNIIVFLKK